MLSITDLLDFIDLDKETVQVVDRATRLPDEEAAAMAAELLRTHRGIYLLHEMFKDQIAEAAAACEIVQERSLRNLRLLLTEVPDSPHALSELYTRCLIERAQNVDKGLSDEKRKFHPQIVPYLTRLLSRAF